MKYQLPTVLFITILLATCLAYHKNLRKSLQRDKCFEFDLKKRSKPLQNSLNLINLFSYHEALTKNQETFISFHQKKEKTKKIAMKETLINETHHNKNNSKNISVYLENKYNAEYLGQIAIGKKKQTFSVIFDTGSYDIIINSKLCLSSSCSNTKQYKGESHFPFMKEFSFGSGVIVGTLSKADFFLGKTKIDNILFYEILAEQSITGDFGDLEGIIGLGPASVSPTPNFFDYLVEQKNLSQIFSVYLNREEDKKKSKIIFGSIPENLFKGSPKYYNINDEYYWAIDMEAIFVGDRDTKLCSKENKCKAVMDTGTSFLASSTKNIMQIASLIEVQGNCENFEKLPDIRFIFDGDSYSLGPKEYLLTITEDGVEPVYTHSKNIVQCVGAFTALDFEGMENYFILGDLFLTKYFSIFDKGNKRIGLALSKQK